MKHALSVIGFPGKRNQRAFYFELLFAEIPLEYHYMFVALHGMAYHIFAGRQRDGADADNTVKFDVVYIPNSQFVVPRHCDHSERTEQKPKKSQQAHKSSVVKDKFRDLAKRPAKV